MRHAISQSRSRHAMSFSATAISALVMTSIVGGCRSSGSAAVPLDAEQYPAAPILSVMVGNWNVEGTSYSPEGEKIVWTGTAAGTVEKTFFLRLDMQIRDPRTGSTIDGANLIGQGGGRAVTMVSTYSTTPELRMYQGELAADNPEIVLTQVGTSSANTRQLVLHFKTADEWTAEAWNSPRSSGSEVPAETITFRRAR